MENEDVRWVQRLSHYSKALGQLRKFIVKGDLNELELQGLIQSFEYTFELAWNVIKDFFEAQGETQVFGSRDAFRMAFNRGMLEEGEVWMDMIKSRTLTTHTYNEDLANSIAELITQKYFSEFERFEKTMKEKQKTNSL